MAGSYSHATTNNGRLRSNQSFPQLVENLGDAYETVEEMYGMIHYLASMVERLSPAEYPKTHEQIVEEARKNYRRGIQMSPGVQPNKPSNKNREPYTFTPPRFLNG